MDTATLGYRIKKCREDAGMERGELARLVKMPYSTLAEIEQGRMSATSKLARIAAVLKVNALWLETGRGAKAASAPASLAEVTPLTEDEARLLAVYRNAQPQVQAAIVRQAQDLADLTRPPSTKRTT